MMATFAAHRQRTRVAWALETIKIFNRSYLKAYWWFQNRASLWRIECNRSPTMVSFCKCWQQCWQNALWLTLCWAGKIERRGFENIKNSNRTCLSEKSITNIIAELCNLSCVLHVHIVYHCLYSIWKGFVDLMLYGESSQAILNKLN